MPLLPAHDEPPRQRPCDRSGPSGIGWHKAEGRRKGGLRCSTKHFCLEVVGGAHGKTSTRVEINSRSNRSGSLHDGQVDLQGRTFQMRNDAYKVIQRGRNRCGIQPDSVPGCNLRLLKSFRSEDQRGLGGAFDDESSGAEEASLPALIGTNSVSGVAGNAHNRGVGNFLTEAQNKGQALYLSDGLGGDDVEVGVLIGGAWEDESFAK